MSSRPTPSSRAPKTPAPQKEWHGQRIFTEEDLGRYFEQEDPRAAVQLRRRRRRRHTAVIVVLVLLLVGVLLAAWQVLRGNWEIPGWEAAPPPAPLSCPVDPVSFSQASTVHVYNGTSIGGLAGEVANDLEARGFTIGTVGNKRLGNQQRVGVVTAGPEGQDTALAVQRMIEGTQFQPDDREDDSVDLVLGVRYQQLVAEDAVDTTAGPLLCPEPDTEGQTSSASTTTTAP